MQISHVNHKKRDKEINIRLKRKIETEKHVPLPIFLHQPKDPPDIFLD